VCGICGTAFIDDPGLLAAMMDALVHRGPDGQGTFRQGPFALGHRRLSIIDPATGKQPMSTPDGRCWIVYNGEVYNYRDLKTELQARGHTFTTQSDTEVVLHAFREYGPACLNRFNGMFAFAVLDTLTGTLFLARDHFGIKPLYYAYRNGRLAFASEIKALLKWHDLPRLPDEDAIYDYLVWGLHDEGSTTFFQGIERLPPAHYLVLDHHGLHLSQYWRPPAPEPKDAAPGQTPSATPKPLDREHAREEFRRLLEDAVRVRLLSDAPVGCCLSGGLDSSSITCLIHRLLEQDPSLRQGASRQHPDIIGQQLKTFSAVFDDPIDERAYIQPVLDATGAESHFVWPSPQGLLQDFHDLIWHQEEPMVSSGPYAQFCVMRAAAGRVKVLLDGQGADELLAGYLPYYLVYLRQLWHQRRLLRMLREAWCARDELLHLLRRAISEKRHRVDPRQLLDPDFARQHSHRRAPAVPTANLKARLHYDVFTRSLPALLRYEDRNSMAFSLESRVPFLDPRLVEFVFSLPDDLIIHNGWNKFILRQALTGILPPKVARRRWKVGFSTPEKTWMAALRTQVQDIIRSHSRRERRYFDPAKVLAAFEKGYHSAIWRALNLEMWLRVFFDHAQ